MRPYIIFRNSERAFSSAAFTFKIPTGIKVHAKSNASKSHIVANAMENCKFANIDEQYYRKGCLAYFSRKHISRSIQMCQIRKSLTQNAILHNKAMILNRVVNRFAGFKFYRPCPMNSTVFLLVRCLICLCYIRLIKLALSG